jgi:hypothetical protein
MVIAARNAGKSGGLQLAYLYQLSQNRAFPSCQWLDIAMAKCYTRSTSERGD